MTSTFLGRSTEVQHLRELQRSCTLVTVTGAGGVGKTRLVREAFRDPGPDAPGGLVVCELAPLRAGSDVAAVNAEVGFASPEAAAASLAGSKAVLVLDNCEHILDAVSLFVSRLVKGDDALRVVATSREPLGVQGEHVMVLSPLTLPHGDVDVDTSPAVQLFLDRAEAAGARWDDSPASRTAIGELCRRLDGLPLAIELAAARARALSPVELLALMSRRLDLLEARSRSVGPPRHRSLRAAIDVSVELLSEPERRAFEALAVFGGPFELDQAHAVIAPGDDDRLTTADLLAGLVDRSLVVAEPTGPSTCYHLLEVLRDRAIEGLVRSGEDAEVAERFVDVTVRRAEQIVQEGLVQWSGELLHRASTSFRDIVSALHWCIEHDDGPHRAYRLVLPLFVALYQGRSAEVMAMGGQVLDRWPGQDAPWRAEALAVLANAAVVAGDRKAADDLGEQALAAPSTVGAAPILARLALGLSARSAGDLDLALDHFGRGRELAVAFGAGSFERELAGFEASMLAMTGDTARGMTMAGTVIDESVASGDGLTEAWARLLRATMAMEAGDWEAAHDDVDRARAATEALASPSGLPWWQGPILRSQATIVAHDATAVGLRRGWEASVDAWRQAVESAAGRGSVGELAMTVRAAAAVAARLGHDAIAVALLDAAPASTELSMVPELFTEDLGRLAAARRPGPPPSDIVTALRLVRAALDIRPDIPVDERTPTAPPGGPAARAGSLHRAGDHWKVVFGGSESTVRHLKGLLDLAVLLGKPGGEVHCLELIGGVQVGGEPGPVIDDHARRDYQRRIVELQQEIDEAHAHANPSAASRAEEELDALVGQLSEAFGLSGRRRSTGSTTERARSAVTYRVRAAIRRLHAVNPDLGRHLDNAVRTGTWCAYRPEDDVRWDIEAS